MVALSCCIIHWLSHHHQWHCVTINSAASPLTACYNQWDSTITEGTTLSLTMPCHHQWHYSVTNRVISSSQTTTSLPGHCIVIKGAISLPMVHANQRHCAITEGTMLSVTALYHRPGLLHHSLASASLPTVLHHH